MVPPRAWAPDTARGGKKRAKKYQKVPLLSGHEVSSCLLLSAPAVMMFTQAHGTKLRLKPLKL